MKKRSNTSNYDIAIIGAGPAGLAAAVGAHEAGAESILIVDREKYPGGILQQCIHPGFGLLKFKEELTAKGITTTIRASRGQDIDAACGQLAGEFMDRTRRRERSQQKHRTVVQ